MNKVIYVVAARPDNKILGCGGTMGKHDAFGDTVKVLIIAEGETSKMKKRNRGNVNNKFIRLRKAAKSAKKIIGIDEI